MDFVKWLDGNGCLDKNGWAEAQGGMVDAQPNFFGNQTENSM